MQVLNISTVETLTNSVWEKWKSCGYTEQPYALTWIEVKNLANHFLKLCREQNRDYREFDFPLLLDHKLNYEENRAEIENQLGGLNSEKENSAKDFMKNYLSDQQLKGYAPEQRDKIEVLETNDKTLAKKVGFLTKKVEAIETQPQTLDTEAIKRELQNMQTALMAKLENIPNLDQQVAALLKSEHFKELGKALSPITEKKQEKPKPRKQLSFPSWLKPKREVKFLDALAGGALTVMFAGFSYGVMQAWGIGWGSIVGLGALWITYVIAFRLCIGGILD